MDKPDGLTLYASDVSGQKRVTLRDVPTEATVGELLESLLSQMELPRNDPDGQPTQYAAHLEREGRHLHASETVGDALAPEDRIRLLPNVDAG